MDPFTRSDLLRLCARLGALVALVSVGVVGVPGAASAATPASQLWVQRYDGPAGSRDHAHALAVSPDGSRIFVTGETLISFNVYDYATVAYDAATGAPLWERRYDGPRARYERASAIAVAVSPDGNAVFVTGSSLGMRRIYDYATIAYDASTGSRLWVKRYDGPAHLRDHAGALGVSPDGSAVFVTGESDRSPGGGERIATVAYDAVTGDRLWVTRDRGHETSFPADLAGALEVSPDGSEVFVTGAIRSGATGYDFATLAYDAATGAKLWTTRYDNPARSKGDVARDLSVSPDGSQVFVTGLSIGSSSGPDYATVAYDAATGVELWVTRYDGPDGGHDYPISVDAGPDGLQVFVTGFSVGSTSGPDYATVAYDTATGAELWVARYDGPDGGHDRAASVGVSPDGSRVVVTGASGGTTSRRDYATVGYDAASGDELWMTRYDGPPSRSDAATALGLSPDGTSVFVTGYSIGATSRQDYATLAFRI